MALGLALSPLARWREVQSTELAWLNAGERKRLAGFTSSARRQQFVAGRWLMRELLAQVHGGEPTEQVVDLHDAARSCLPRGHANLSHSGDWLVVVQADLPVGVDLERLRPRRDLLGLARMVHSPAQCEALAALDGEARLHQFYRWWTLKEAWLKARGQGLDMARMRGLDFTQGTAEHSDTCSTLLPRAGLALSICCDEIDAARLPVTLADEPLVWQFYQSTPKSK